MKNIVELYCIVDDVVKIIEQRLNKKNGRGRKNKLNKSELITMALIGHFNCIETDKMLYEYVSFYLKTYFHELPCYEQFSRGVRSISKFLDLLLDVLCKLNSTDEKDFYIIDSTALPVSSFNPVQCPKWASNEAKLGKNIFGYYFGFKLHIIIKSKHGSSIM